MSDDDVFGEFEAARPKGGARVDPQASLDARIEENLKLADAGAVSGSMYKRVGEDRYEATLRNGVKAMNVGGVKTRVCHSRDELIKFFTRARDVNAKGGFKVIFDKQSKPKNLWGDDEALT